MLRVRSLEGFPILPKDVKVWGRLQLTLAPLGQPEPLKLLHLNHLVGPLCQSGVITHLGVFVTLFQKCSGYLHLQ